MKVLKQGHVYEVDHLDGDNKSNIRFVDRGHGKDTEGTTCQELLRVLIDRVQFLNREVHWEGNAEIIQHLRLALILFEMRALYRKVEKRKLIPEMLDVDESDLHIRLNIIK